MNPIVARSIVIQVQRDRTTRFDKELRIAVYKEMQYFGYGPVFDLSGIPDSSPLTSSAADNIELLLLNDEEKRAWHVARELTK